MAQNIYNLLKKHEREILTQWGASVAVDGALTERYESHAWDILQYLQHYFSQDEISPPHLPSLKSLQEPSEPEFDTSIDLTHFLQKGKEVICNVLSKNEQQVGPDLPVNLDKAFSGLWPKILSRSTNNVRRNQYQGREVKPRNYSRFNLLYNAFHYSTDGILITDLQGKIIEANKAFLNLFGYSPEEIIGKRTDILRSSKTTDELYNKIWNSINAKGEWKGDIINKTKSGDDIPVWLSITPIFENGEKIGYMALEIDMRHQKLLEARILQNERLAAIGQMAARIAHEIRNPISSIGLNAELLEDEITGPERNTSNEAKVLLKSIMNEVDRVANLLDEYLQFSRFPSTQLKPGNITVLIREVLGDFEMAAKADAINIFSQFEPDLPDINFDALQMRRVIMNLCRNSIEAMPMGGTLELHVQRKDDHLLEIRVSDTGLGISKEDKDRIFKPFYTTKESGTGLGLSIIQQIILEHNGNIYCESENGRGTIFYITLPLKNV